MSTRQFTGTRAMPSGANDRLAMLSKAATDDETRGLLQSAETNLRLALCFVPGDAKTTASLERVVAARERARRASNP